MALQINPNFAKARRELGRLLAENGDTIEAIVELRRAVMLEPDNATARHYLGTALAKSKQYDEAIKEFGAAIAVAA